VTASDQSGQIGRQSGQIVQYTDDTRSFVTRQIAGETLIMPVAGRVTDLESIYVLNEVASRIWQLVASPATVDRIVETIAGEFDVTADRAAADVAEFLGTLDARGLIRTTEAG
jgi:Coenzyme PQQ synthesis protein D (PqqD)